MIYFTVSHTLSTTRHTTPPETAASIAFINTTVLASPGSDVRIPFRATHAS